MSIELTLQQSQVLARILAFVQDDSLDAFILRGSAGTGKTTLIASLVQELTAMQLSFSLLAPTGRAARILGTKVRQQLQKSPDGQNNEAPIAASTIHSAIYALKSVQVHEQATASNDPGIRMIFPLNTDEPAVNLYIIDESSMLGDHESRNDFMQFGSGRLLHDVITHARASRAGRGDQQQPVTKLLFVGDPAQLAPVGSDHSPALRDDYLRQHHRLRVVSADLTQVQRQSNDSAILARATELRSALHNRQFGNFDLLPDQQEITAVSAKTAVDLALECIRQRRQFVVIAHSNRTALDYNRTIRARRWGSASLPVQPGDILLVNRNSPTGLRNGDLIKVRQASAHAEVEHIALRGGHKVTLQFRQLEIAYRNDAGDVITRDVRILENQLDSIQRGLTALEQRALLAHFRLRHPELSPRSDEFRKALGEDPYFNALQTKYGYAMTCHKAQGGEWPLVIIDFNVAGHMQQGAPFFRWAYTAITRAAERLVVVNMPRFHTRNAPAPTAPPTACNRAAAQTMGTPAALMPLHWKLSQAWAEQGIRILHLQHLSACERYTLERQGQRTRVQYHYNAQHQPRLDAIAPERLDGTDLAHDALRTLHHVIVQPEQTATTESSNAAATPPDRISPFLRQLACALLQADIRVQGHRLIDDDRLRVAFADSYRYGEIDFTYDNTHGWSNAQEIGYPGSTSGLHATVCQQLANMRQPV